MERKQIGLAGVGSGRIGAPRAIVMALHGEIVKILGVTETRDKLLPQGFEPVGGTPEEFAAYIKAAGIKAD